MSLTIEKLAVGDAVIADTGRRGRVAKLTRDHAHVEWGDEKETRRHTDADLAAHGIAKVSPFDDNAEDTTP